MITSATRLPDSFPHWAICLALTGSLLAFSAHAQDPAAPELSAAAAPHAETTGVGTADVRAVESSIVRDLRNLGIEIGVQLTENAWDFTNPDSIPGFASQPHYVRPDPETRD